MEGTTQMPVFMPFKKELQPATFIRRLNRFVVDVDLAGKVIQAHLHDPGRLKEILVPGTTLFLEPAGNKNRKTAFTVSLAQKEGVFISLNSILPNRFMEFCLTENALHEFRDYSLARREVPFGNSRFDFHLMGAGIDIFLEVKSVTLVKDGLALFPDAPTVRGSRHIRELMDAARSGICGTIFFLVQREDADAFQANTETDPTFSAVLHQAFVKGIEIIAYTSRLNRDGISLGKRIPVQFP